MPPEKEKFTYPDALNPLAAAFLRQMPARDYETASIPDIREGMAGIGPFIFAPPEQNVIILNRQAGNIPVRIYTPVFPETKKPMPIMIYSHGGAWCLGNLDMADNFCSAVANLTGITVVSVDYRLAPEHPYPAGLNDAYDTVVWATGKDSGFINCNPKKIIVAGASAGANLAAAVCLRARNEHGPTISGQVLIYPVTDIGSTDTESYRKYGNRFGLDKVLMQKTAEAYAPDPEIRKSPYVSVLRAGDFSSLPPAIVITAGFDPLRDEGIAYVKKLKAAAVKTVHLHYPDMLHGFVEFSRIFPEQSRQAVEAMCEAMAAWLKCE